MKKLFPITAIAMFAALSFTSCKKDHTCTCKIHDTYYDTTTGSNGQDSVYVGMAMDSTYSVPLGKQSKSDAQNACNTDQKQLSEVFDSVSCGI